MAMRQPLICHCNFLDPGSVGASTLGLPSLVVIFNVIEEKMCLSMLGSLCEAAVIQLSFLQALHGVTRDSVVDPRRCCTKETNREIRQRLELSINRRTRCSFASLLDVSLMNVGLVVG